MKLFKIKVLLLILLILIFSLFILLKKNPLQEKDKFIKTRIGNRIFTLDVADTDELRSKGLSGRQSMPKENGMLFVFDKKDKYSFWMKEMYIALDFIWVEDKEIKDISENIQPPVDLNSSDLQLVTPRQPINKVIEVNAGIIEELKIKIGDKIEFIPPSPR